MMDVLSMFRHGLHQSDNVNPILSHFKIGRQVSNAGQEMIWKVYEAHRIADSKKASVFIFEKKVADKLHKPKRKELVVELVRRELSILVEMKHNKILKLIHPVEECNASIAFATEPVKASLANLLSNCDKLPVNIQQELKEQTFLDVELKCGIYQVAEAINYLHVTRKMVHLNICPQNIIVTKKGTWKIMGFGFAKISDPEALDDHFPSQPWQAKFSKMVQPDLDFVAPEIQSEIRSQATWASDVFSLGMVICWVFNGGRSLLQAAYSPSLYAKQINRLEELYSDVASRIPAQLSDTLQKMIKKEPQARPSVQYVTMLKYFDDPVVESLHMLDSIIEAKDSFVCSKDFIDALAHNLSQVPAKVLHDCIYPTISENLQLPDKVPTTLPVLLSLLDIANEEDCKSFVQVELKNILTSNQPAQVCVYLLERLDTLMSKCTEDEIKTDILPMLFTSLVSNNIQCQEAAINAFSSIRTYLDEQTTRNLVLPKAKALFSKATNVRTRLIALQCIDKLVDSLEKMVILDDVLPFLIDIQCFDVDIVMSVVESDNAVTVKSLESLQRTIILIILSDVIVKLAIYKHLLSDKKYGMTHNLLATKVMPSLVPLTVYPGLSITQFNSLMEILHDMLSQIEHQRLNKMITELPSQDAINRQRRTSMDTRAGPSTKVVHGNMAGNQGLLNVDFGSYRPPSTPEFSIQAISSRENLENPGYKRHASFQSLGMAEQAVFEMVRQRRLSQMSGRSDQGLQNPHIHISQASISTGFKENVAMFFSKHRDSTVSIGPIVLPDFGRRESSGKLFGNTPIRRSSFQGICESAMQYFGVK